MKRVLSAILVLLVLLSLCACGSDKETETTPQTETIASYLEENCVPTETEPATEPSAEPTAETAVSGTPVSVSSYDDLDALYTFQLSGKTYSLPCTVSEFLDNGCMIYERTLNNTIPAQRIMGQIRVYPEGNEDSYIELNVMNDTENDMTVQECNKVVGIKVREDSNVSLILSTGIDIGSGTVDPETMKASYGTDSACYWEKNGTVQWHFYKLINPDFDDTFVMGIGPGMDELTISESGIDLKYCGRP